MSDVTKQNYLFLREAIELIGIEKLLELQRISKNLVDGADDLDVSERKNFLLGFIEGYEKASLDFLSDGNIYLNFLANKSVTGIASRT